MSTQGNDGSADIVSHISHRFCIYLFLIYIIWHRFVRDAKQQMTLKVHPFQIF